MNSSDNQSDDESRARRRLVGFGLHLVGYFIVAAGVFFTSVSGAGDLNRFVIVLVGWGSVLALHAAFVMGLFRVFSGRKD